MVLIFSRWWWRRGHCCRSVTHQRQDCRQVAALSCEIQPSASGMTQWHNIFGLLECWVCNTKTLGNVDLGLQDVTLNIQKRCLCKAHRFNVLLFYEFCRCEQAGSSISCHREWLLKSSKDKLPSTKRKYQCRYKFSTNFTAALLKRSSEMQTII